MGKTPWRRKWLLAAVLLAWEIPWTERSLAGHSPWGSLRVGHDSATGATTHPNPSPSDGTVVGDVSGVWRGGGGRGSALRLRGRRRSQTGTCEGAHFYFFLAASPRRSSPRLRQLSEAGIPAQKVRNQREPRPRGWQSQRTPGSSGGGRARPAQRRREEAGMASTFLFTRRLLLLPFLLPLFWAPLGAGE